MKHFLLFLFALVSTTFAADKKHILLLAGNPSHGPGDHEYNAGVQLLAKCLTENAADLVEVKFYLNSGWPTPEELKQADTIVFYCNGGFEHFFLPGPRLKQLDNEMKRGCGFVALHFAVEFPKSRNQQAFEWLGGYFEEHWSVNPYWSPDFKELPKHPITNGVKPFVVRDEWYFHLRFTEQTDKVFPILQAVAPDATMERPDGSHTGNPAARASVAAKKPQIVAWTLERPDGGRGFGFTGGHFHKNWGNDDQRKLVLNAILWSAKATVPDKGVESKVTEADLAANLDPKGK